MHGYLPDLAHHFHVLPRDLDHMTMAEVQLFKAAVDQVRKEDRELERKTR